MTETAKERIYRERLELISDKSNWHMNFKSSTIKMMMKNAKQALELAENLPDTTDKLSVEKLQERCDRYEKALTEISKMADSGDVTWNENIKAVTNPALAAIGGDDEL